MRLAVGTILVAALVQPLAAATIPVRYGEGVTRGFLVVYDTQGVLIGHGDLIQTQRDGQVDKRMILRFKDGSVLDETVVFSQKSVYALQTYHLSEKGPTFDADTEISLTKASGAYRLTRKDHKDGDEKVLDGVLDLPADVYNGMLITVSKDLPKGGGETVHFVAFTPQPKIIEIAITPLAAEDKIKVGDLTKSAVHYVMKPRLGMWLKFFATILGRTPPDLHLWILAEEVTAFVGFEGIVGTTNTIWRIETVSPRRSE